MGYKGISFCSYQEFVRIAFGPFILNLEYRNFRYKRIITQLTLFVKRQTENSAPHLSGLRRNLDELTKNNLYAIIYFTGIFCLYFT